MVNIVSDDSSRDVEGTLLQRRRPRGSGRWSGVRVCRVMAAMLVLVSCSSGSNSSTKSTTSTTSKPSRLERVSGGPTGSYVVAPGIHKIKHVIVIMQENRSFDSYFGTFPGADGIPMRNGKPTVCVPDPARPARASRRTSITRT